MRFGTTLVIVAALCTESLVAQRPLSRAQAIETALERGARIGVARADTAVASAALVAARVLPNPSASASYSKSPPNYHFSFDVPFDFPSRRRLGIRSATLGLRAAQARYQFERAIIAMEADTTYTRALAAREKIALSRRNALDADSLLHMAERRRDAGDASDMDVELARVNAGQQANLVAADSLTLLTLLLDLQAVLGVGGDSITVTPVDSLTMPPAAEGAVPKSLSEVSASLALEAAALNVRLQRRSLWSGFSLSVGAEHRDPDLSGILPTVGIGFGLPIFDRNRGAIAQAEAERLRAQAELTLTQVDARHQVAHAVRERESALARAQRDRQLIASATRVAGMALIAYREGASSLANVLEAQRTAREVLVQYIEDLAAAWVATAELRVYSRTQNSTEQR